MFDFKELMRSSDKEDTEQSENEKNAFDCLDH